MPNNVSDQVFREQKSLLTLVYLYAVKNRKKTLALIVLCYILSIYYGTLKHRTQAAWRTFASWLLDRTKRRKDEPSFLRGQFVNNPISKSKPDQNHSHGPAAAARSTAVRFFDLLAARTGKTIYSFQQSKADVKHRRGGFRNYYWSKDVDVPVSLEHPKPNDLVTMIDVDYYIDMNEFLAHCENPVGLYTMLPTAVAEKHDNNYCFTFNENNEMSMNVTGGGTYVHKLWNWSQDTVKCTATFFGIVYKTKTYHIEKRMLGKHHGVVLLVPQASWYGIPGWIADKVLSSQPLARLTPVVDKYLRMRVLKATGHEISTGLVNNFNSVNIPIHIDDAIAVSARTSKTDIVAPTIQSYLTIPDQLEARYAANALLEYHRSCVGYKAPVVYPVPHAVLSFQYCPKEYNPDSKPLVVPFMPPIMHNAITPDDSVNNVKQCIKGRIAGIDNELPFDPQLHTFMEEFVHFLIPDPHQLIPVDHEEVFARQPRPSQQSILSQAVEMARPLMRRIEMFIKKECYGKVTDPRPISQINGVDKLEYSRVLYSLYDVVKKHKWYAFGRTPREIAEAVAGLAMRTRGCLIKSDLSRFDGHVIMIMRMLEEMILTRAFDTFYTAMVIELHKSQYNMKGKCTRLDNDYAATPIGTTYDQLAKRASGSPETSVFATMINAFIAYATKRATYHNGAYLTPQQAWDDLGMYGGDDGLTGDVDPATYTRWAARCGQELTAEAVPRGEFGVQFLSRVYGPNVWFGDPNSCCDIPRQLGKLHVTVKMPPSVTPYMKLVEKLRSLYLTDRNTPIFAPLIERVIVKGEKEDFSPTEDPLFLRSWHSKVSKEDQYPNEDQDWMYAYGESVLPTFDWPKFSKWLIACNHTEEWLAKTPLCVEPQVPNVKEDVVVSGELLTAPPKATQEGTKPARKGKNAQRRIRKKVTSAPRNAAERKDVKRDSNGSKGGSSQRPKPEPKKPDYFDKFN